MAIKKTTMPKLQSTPVKVADNLPLTTADFGLVSYLGRDFELTLMAMVPDILAVNRDPETSGPSGAKVKEQYITTARVRMGPTCMAYISSALLGALKDVAPEIYEPTIAAINSELEKN